MCSLLLISRPRVASAFGQPQLSARASSSRELVIKVVLCTAEQKERVDFPVILQGKDRQERICPLKRHRFTNEPVINASARFFLWSPKREAEGQFHHSFPHRRSRAHTRPPFSLELEPGMLQSIKASSILSAARALDRWVDDYNARLDVYIAEREQDATALSMAPTKLLRTLSGGLSRSLSVNSYSSAGEATEEDHACVSGSDVVTSSDEPVILRHTAAEDEPSPKLNINKSEELLAIPVPSWEVIVWPRALILMLVAYALFTALVDKTEASPIEHEPIDLQPAQDSLPLPLRTGAGLVPANSEIVSQTNVVGIACSAAAATVGFAAYNLLTLG